MIGRDFNGSSDFITLAQGGIPTTLAGLTMAAIVNLDAVNRWNNIIGLETSAAGHVAAMTVTNGNALRLDFSTGGRDTVTGIDTGAQMLALAKATGNVIPTGLRYLYSTGAFTETNGTAIGEGGAGSVGKATLGAFTSSSDFLDGKMYLAAVWTRALSSAEMRRLPFSLMAWLDSAPVALWTLDQSAIGQLIRDLVGTSHQSAISGTAVGTVSLPSFTYGHEIWTPGVSTAAGTTVSPASITRARALGTPVVNPQLLPASIVHARAIGTPTVSTFVTVTPSSIVHARAIGTPTVNPSIVPSSIVHARAIGTPTVNPQLLPVSIVRSRAIGALSVDDGLPDAAVGQRPPRLDPVFRLF